MIQLEDRNIVDLSVLAAAPDRDRRILSDRVKVLRLRGNRLTNVGGGALQSLRHLTDIDLSGNRISSLEGGLPPLLTTLNLAHNDLEALGVGLAACTRLTHLDVSHNVRLSSLRGLPEVAAVPLEPCAAVPRFTLLANGNRISSCRAIAKSIGRCLVRCELRSNRFTDFSHFVDVLAVACPRLEHLDIAGNPALLPSSGDQRMHRLQIADAIRVLRSKLRGCDIVVASRSDEDDGKVDEDSANGDGGAAPASEAGRSAGGSGNFGRTAAPLRPVGRRLYSPARDNSGRDNSGGGDDSGVAHRHQYSDPFRSGANRSPSAPASASSQASAAVVHVVEVKHNKGGSSREAPPSATVSPPSPPATAAGFASSSLESLRMPSAAAAEAASSSGHAPMGLGHYEATANALREALVALDVERATTLRLRQELAALRRRGDDFAAAARRRADELRQLREDLQGANERADTLQRRLAEATRQLRASHDAAVRPLHVASLQQQPQQEAATSTTYHRANTAAGVVRRAGPTNSRSVARHGSGAPARGVVPATTTAPSSPGGGRGSPRSSTPPSTTRSAAGASLASAMVRNLSPIGEGQQSGAAISMMATTAGPSFGSDGASGDQEHVTSTAAIIASLREDIQARDAHIAALTAENDDLAATAQKLLTEKLARCEHRGGSGKAK